MNSPTVNKTDIPPRKSKVVGTSVTSPIPIKKRAEVKIRIRHPVLIFYIGGAGDKRKYAPLPAHVAGPFRNVLDARAHVNTRVKSEIAAKLVTDVWLGYYEIYGLDLVKKTFCH